MKYLILSFDDGTVYDRRIVELLNKYQMKGTFFLNSGTLDKPGYLSGDELSTLFKGHEIGSHSINHIKLKELDKSEIQYQIEEDIVNIEQYTKEKVRGFAYPFGEHNKKVRDVVKSLGLNYARTTTGTKEFKRPKDFLVWDPTLHFSGMAWDTEDRERRNRGVQFMLDKVEEFLDDWDSEVLHIWLHSWEFKDDRFKWDQFERLCRIVSQEDEVEFVTCSEYYDKVNK